MNDDPILDDARNDSLPNRDSGDPAARRGAWLQAIAVTACVGVVVAYAFGIDRAGPGGMLPPLGGAYGVLAAAALLHLHRHGELREQLAPRRLDVTMGAVVAGVLYLLASVVPAALLHDRPEEQWLLRTTIQIGLARDLAPPYVGATIFAIAAAEELVWRGWVMRALRAAHGKRVALVATTLLCTAAHASTVVLLRMPEAGLNPLVALGTLGGGLVWGAMALGFDRLGPSLFAHAFFSWAIALFPMWYRP